MSTFKRVLRISLEVIVSGLLIACAVFFYFLLYAFCLAPTGLFGTPNDCNKQEILVQIVQLVPLTFLPFYRPLKDQKHLLVSVVILAGTQLYILFDRGGLLFIYTDSYIGVAFDWITTGVAAILLTILYFIHNRLLK